MKMPLACKTMWGAADRYAGKRRVRDATKDEAGRSLPDPRFGAFRLA